MACGGDPRYEQAYNEPAHGHRYHSPARNRKVNYPVHVNHSDDELAFLSYYPLLNYETEPKLRGVYVQSLERSWRVERPERNPLWNFIYAVGSGNWSLIASNRSARFVKSPWIKSCGL